MSVNSAGFEGESGCYGAGIGTAHGELAVRVQAVEEGCDLPPIFSPGIMRLSPVFVRPTCLS